MQRTCLAVNKMNPDIEPVILANPEFSIDLLKELCKAKPLQNVLFSPLSISSALGLVLLGAKNDTLEQMKKDFLDECEEWCFGSLRNADFKTNPDAAREQINAWVKTKTDGDVSEDTSLALISTIYFKQNWAKQFEIKHTGKDWPVMGKEDKIPLGTIPHRHHVDYPKFPPEARILEIPYEYKHLSMFVILPNEGTDLQKLIDSITYEKILVWTQPDNMIPTEVTVEMPMFTLQEKYDLEETLNLLGIKDLFSDKCDLSGMAPDKLKLSKMVHKSVVNVDENGTGAVGGSGGVVQTLQSKQNYEPFIVEPPFLFFIRHNSTKSILFWGRVITPKPEN
ncbi:leukocyte elastase inhibitor-like protein [Labeo rohita]|uniref:Leukocyte elastase inhibitor-like protein n=1 Tax=Labeo rohita TaxID=84645 RepID=A0A498LBF6_LABRO|nr:leukocyte elastase inhibitor-like protein [Labeo rohita]RXN05590.1 leukocyte elastase inhibitor-like protein [Labeo rohita]